MERIKGSLWLADRPQGPEDHVIRGEPIANLMRHFRMLPRRDQELLSLRFDGELANGQIAQIMRMTQINVRVSIFRALKRLRGRVQEEKAES